MEMLSQTFKTWYQKYDDVEKCRLIKDKAIHVNMLHKRMVKACNNEITSNAQRRGIRGGTFTTLVCRSQRATSDYLNNLDELQYMVDRL